MPAWNFLKFATSLKEPPSGCTVGSSLPAGAVAAPVHRAVRWPCRAGSASSSVLSSGETLGASADA